MAICRRCVTRGKRCGCERGCDVKAMYLLCPITAEDICNKIPRQQKIPCSRPELVNPTGLRLYPLWLGRAERRYDSGPSHTRPLSTCMAFKMLAGLRDHSRTCSHRYSPLRRVGMICNGCARFHAHHTSWHLYSSTEAGRISGFK